MRRTAAVRAAEAGSPGGGPVVGDLDRHRRSAGRLRLREPHRPRALRRRQRHGAAAAVGVERHRRQLRHAVRAERAPEVDGLAAGAAQLEEGDARHAAAMRATPASVAAAPAIWCGAMRSRSMPKASSTVTTG